MEGPEFLKQKYPDLHTTPAVESAVRNADVHKDETDETVSQKPADRIEKYLERLERLILDPEEKQDLMETAGADRPRALSILREMVMNKYVRPNKEKLAQGAAVVEERAARQMGMDVHYGEEQLEQRGEVAVKDLESSLDQWIGYLSDPNEPYPTWFRYYAFRNILDLGEYDKDKQEFPKRTEGTVRLFPDIDRGALARIEDIIECSRDPEKLKRFRSAQQSTQTPEQQLLTVEKAKAFGSLSFAKQYTESMKEAGEITPEMRAETRGEWVKYDQDSDPTALWASLQNKGTAWCTKGLATAETQLKGGDFYVYYTLDKQGKPTIPRIAIRMQNRVISEARGVADSQQNVENNMIDIADAKMSELPGKEKYLKISADMKQMTALYTKSFKEDRKTGAKTYLNPVLTKDELAFLYELNAPIEGFGYKKDPRIAELRAQRNTEQDLPIIFDCAPEQIAHTVSEINENTKAYVGELEVGIFQKLPPTLEHVYTSFPENRIQFKEIEIGGKTREQLFVELKNGGIEMSDDAKSMMDNPDFAPSENIEKASLVSLTVESLGLKDGAKLKDLYTRAEEFDLELCPAEVGPQLRLQYDDQPNKEHLRIAMKPIAGSVGLPSLFGVGRYRDGTRWLDHDRGDPGSVWYGYRFVFLRRT